MRQDMKKVIIERPRDGAILSYRKKIGLHQLDEDNDILNDGPTRIGLKRNALITSPTRTKSQTDLMGPLTRFLTKRLGRKWDDVWSEICRYNKCFMGEHLKDHVKNYVCTNPRVGEDGCLYNQYGRNVERNKNRFYVHPETGLLHYGNGLDWKYDNKRVYKIVEMDGKEYYKHNGIWYRVKTQALKDMNPTRRGYRWYWSYDFLNARLDRDEFHTPLYYLDLLNTYGKEIACTWKQAANKKECKALNKIA
jgi:hypothetical protein